jgi:hypothetical protein
LNDTNEFGIKGLRAQVRNLQEEARSVFGTQSEALSLMCTEFAKHMVSFRRIYEELKQRHFEDLSRLKRDHQRQLDIMLKNDRAQERVIANLMEQHQLDIKKLKSDMT